ncbi:hypothetical protein U1Q18_021421 [Sarracenia purpurea var. burkii]
MATAPVKSQPLHNFSLPLLRWGHKNQMNSTHRYRRPSETILRHSPSPPVDHYRSSPSEQDFDGGDSGGGGCRNESESDNRRLPVGSRSAQRNRFSFASCSSQKQQAAVLEREGNDVEGESEREKVCNEVDAEESLAKPWNLRPRKAVSKTGMEIGRASKNGELQDTVPTVPEILEVQQTENVPKSMRLRGFAEGHGLEKKEKRKFWIALSREEIEEDVFAITGSRPARRPKKRPKSIQKQLDNIFPGLYLAGVSADSYRVSDVLK